MVLISRIHFWLLAWFGHKYDANEFGYNEKGHISTIQQSVAEGFPKWKEREYQKNVSIQLENRNTSTTENWIGTYIVLRENMYEVTVNLSR